MRARVPLTADVIAAALVAAQRADGQPLMHLTDPVCYVKKMVLAAALDAVAKATGTRKHRLGPIMLLWLSPAQQLALINGNWSTAGYKHCRAAASSAISNLTSPVVPVVSDVSDVSEIEVREAASTADPQPKPQQEPASASPVHRPKRRFKSTALSADQQVARLALIREVAQRFADKQASRLPRAASAPVLSADQLADLPPVPPVLSGRQWTAAYIAERNRVLGLHRARAKELAKELSNKNSGEQAVAS